MFDNHVLKHKFSHIIRSAFQKRWKICLIILKIKFFYKVRGHSAASIVGNREKYSGAWPIN